MTGEEAGARQADSASKPCPETAVLNRSWESAEKVRKWVEWVIPRRLNGRDASAIAARAQLRHGAGKEVGAVPSIWAYTLESQRPELSDQRPSWGENAVHTALTLWARHQGSNAAPMHMVDAKETPRSFGSAVRALAGACPPWSPLRPSVPFPTTCGASSICSRRRRSPWTTDS